MLCFCQILKFLIVLPIYGRVYVYVQCSCSTCGGPKYNFYNNMQSSPCSCKNCQKYQVQTYAAVFMIITLKKSYTL